MDNGITLVITKKGYLGEIVKENVKHFSFATAGLDKDILVIHYMNGKTEKIFEVTSFYLEP